jgi:hypothetical protein
MERVDRISGGCAFPLTSDLSSHHRFLPAESPKQPGAREIHRSPNAPEGSTGDVWCGPLEPIELVVQAMI